ncbi:MAG: HupE/UreJ family protein, partial [Desulfofustis sp.]
PAAMIRRQRYWEPVTEFRSALFYVIKIVTLFTIAHTMTLSLAAFKVFDLPPRLVESVIAISIAAAALDILLPVFKKKIAWVVFIFGLFHGFGFASVLAHLGVLGEHMALSLFGFNLGVELGQIAVILVIFPLLYMIRNYAFFPRIILRFGAVLLIGLSTVWFIERAVLGATVMKYVEASLAQLLS